MGGGPAAGGVSEAGERPPPPLAAPGARLGGALVDGASLQALALLLGGAGSRAAAVTGTVVYLGYVIAATVLRGQTLGKLAMGTRIVDAATGQLPTLWQAATRAVVPLAGLVVDVALGGAAVAGLWVLVVYGWLLLDDRRRGLHDKAAGTEVVRLERSDAHRWAGVAAVAAALAVTAVLVAEALEELEDDQDTPAAAAGPGRT